MIKIRCSVGASGIALEFHRLHGPLIGDHDILQIGNGKRKTKGHR